MEFEGFEMLIQGEFIYGVLKPFSPSIDYRREYQGHHYPGYEIGIATKTCKFLIVWEEGSGVMIAPLSSNYENTHDDWFSLRKIVNFVACQPFIWESPYQGISRDDKLTQHLYTLRKEAVPYINQIVTMFSNVESMNEWASKYDEYEDEQFRIKYPGFYEEYKKRKSSK